MKKDVITNEAIMSDKVKIALTSGLMKSLDGKRLKCDIALREFKFREGIYDVVGYNKQENTVYIVECKLGTNITSIGQAFGQILAYKSVLTGRGYEFLLRFYQKYNEDVIKRRGYLKIQLEDWIRILERKKMNFKFFVAVKEQARRMYKEIISIKSNMNFRIGTLMVTKDGVCTPRFWIKDEIDKKLAETDSIVISLVKKYGMMSFLEAIEEKLNILLPDEYSKFKTYKATTNVKQFKLFPSTHYEIWVMKNKIEIALHVEAGRKKTEKILSFLKSKEGEVKSSLGKHVKIEEWGKGWTTGKGSYWARVYERVARKDLNEDFLNEISERIKEYIEILQPLLKQMKLR